MQHPIAHYMPLPSTLLATMLFWLGYRYNIRKRDINATGLEAA